MLILNHSCRIADSNTVYCKIAKHYKIKLSEKERFFFQKYTKEYKVEKKNNNKK